jgi:hypothetical protein
MRRAKPIAAFVLGALLAGGVVSAIAEDRKPDDVPAASVKQMLFHLRALAEDERDRGRLLETIDGYLRWANALEAPREVRARMAANEKAAIASLRALVAAQARHKEAHGVYAPSLEDLRAAGLIGESLASGLESGYRFRLLSPAPRRGWAAGADPETVGETAIRFLFVDESGVIRFSLAGPATVSSTPEAG